MIRVDNALEAYKRALFLTRNDGIDYTREARERGQQAGLTGDQIEKDIQEAKVVCAQVAYKRELFLTRENGVDFTSDARKSGKLAGIPEEQIEKEVQEALANKRK